MRLADFLLFHTQTVQIRLRTEDPRWYPITAATLARIPSAHLAHEALVTCTRDVSGGRLWIGDESYSWRFVRPDPMAVDLPSLAVRWRTWLCDAQRVGEGSRPRPVRRRAVLRTAVAGLAHALSGG